MFHTAYSYNTPYHIKRVFFLNELGRIIRLQFLPFWGDFWLLKANFRPETTLQRASNAIIQYINNIWVIGADLDTYWVILGHVRSILSQLSALPKLLTDTIVLYAYCVFNAYFTILNLTNDHMKHPCSNMHESCLTHSSHQLDGWAQMAPLWFETGKMQSRNGQDANNGFDYVSKDFNV
jgi:hypothetical protein